MSFGFSISDIVLLTQLTTSTYEGWKKACGDYASITCDLVVLQTLLQRMEAEAQAPDSLFTRNSNDIKGWKSLSRGCRETVTELAEILDKYRSLSTNRRKNWDRIRLGNKNLDGLGRDLVKKTASLAAFASIVGVSSQGRVENEIFPELIKRMDDIAEQVRKGNASVSTMTTYADDDKTLWRDFRRDMIRAGFRSSDVHRYSSALRTHLAHLQREGLLDEVAPRAASDDDSSPVSVGYSQGDFEESKDEEISEALLDEDSNSEEEGARHEDFGQLMDEDIAKVAMVEDFKRKAIGDTEEEPEQAMDDETTAEAKPTDDSNDQSVSEQSQDEVPESDGMQVALRPFSGEGECRFVKSPFSFILARVNICPETAAALVRTFPVPRKRSGV